jgi:hypothetical protein
MQVQPLRCRNCQLRLDRDVFIVISKIVPKILPWRTFPIASQKAMNWVSRTWKQFSDSLTEPAVTEQCHLSQHEQLSHHQCTLSRVLEEAENYRNLTSNKPCTVGVYKDKHQWLLHRQKQSRRQSREAFSMKIYYVVPWSRCIRSNDRTSESTFSKLHLRNHPKPSFW